VIATLAANATSYADTGLAAGTLYAYNVQAVNLTGSSAAASFSVTTVTTAPTNVAAVAGNAKVTLSWAAPAGAASFNIYRASTSGGEGSTPLQTGVTATSFTDRGLSNGSTYYYEVSAVDTGGESSLSSEVKVTLGQGVAVSLEVSSSSLSPTAGRADPTTVTVLDALGNTVTNYTGTVHFTSSDPQAVLPANYTFRGGDQGVHTFRVTLKTAGSQSLTITDTVNSSLTGKETGITVVAAAARSLKVTGFPTKIHRGTAATFTVTAVDAFGNIATGYRGAVHFTSSDAAAVLPANYTFTSGDAGVHTFTVTLKTHGTQSITATDTRTSGITGTESGIKVSDASRENPSPDASPEAADMDDHPVPVLGESPGRSDEPEVAFLPAALDWLATATAGSTAAPWDAFLVDVLARRGAPSRLTRARLGEPAAWSPSATEAQTAGVRLATVVAVLGVAVRPRSASRQRRPETD
jgi:fibronectin type 3 domain-containing protein